jgi:hypothetical protein
MPSCTRPPARTRRPLTRSRITRRLTPQAWIQGQLTVIATFPTNPRLVTQKDAQVAGKRLASEEALGEAQENQYYVFEPACFVSLAAQLRIKPLQ